MNPWLAPLLISLLALAAGFEPSHAEDRATLDRCEKQLAACYQNCKVDKPAQLCNAQCSTVLCGLAWRESFSGFQDRRIEETAGTGLTGLTIKKDRHIASR